MELYQKMMLKHLLSYYGEKDLDPAGIVHDAAYQALNLIKLILEDDRLDDPECFWKIEQIVRVFEELGSNAGTRHDFG